MLSPDSPNQQVQTLKPTGAQGPLQDVLEAPALIDTCVRNGHFDEALDLRVRFRGSGFKAKSYSRSCVH